MTKLELKVAQRLAKIIVNYRDIMCSGVIKKLLNDEAKQLIKLIKESK
jgi:hypothetical protein